MTVLDFVTLTRRSWKVLVLLVVIGLVAAGGYVLLAPKVYQASSNGFLTVTGSNIIAGSDQATQQAGSYLPLITSTPVYDRIAKNDGIPASELQGRLSASLVAGSTMIQVTATSSTPQGAARLANGALTALSEVITQIEQAGGNTQGALKVVPLDNATAPSIPISPKKSLVLPLGALAGLILGYIIVFLRRALDVKVRSNTDMLQMLGTGVLGSVPKLGGRGGARGPQGERLSAESFRQIRTGLRFASVDGEVRSIVVSSPNQSEGKSTTAARLAGVIAESDTPTLIIDGDLRRPAVARQFDIDGSVGLSEVLSGQMSLTDAIRPSGRPNLFVLPSGGIPPNPSEMLGAHALETLMQQLREKFFVVLDAPPVLPVTDALLIGHVTDGMLFVVAVGQTRKTEVAAARRLIEQAHVRLLGAVLNKVSVNDREGGYSYYHNNRSYYTRPQGKRSTRADSKKGAPSPLPPAEPLIPAGFEVPASSPARPQPAPVHLERPAAAVPVEQPVAAAAGVPVGRADPFFLARPPQQAAASAPAAPAVDRAAERGVEPHTLASDEASAWPFDFGDEPLTPQRPSGRRSARTE